MRRTICPLTAAMAQDVTVDIAAEHGLVIDVPTAQKVLTFHTSWPLGTADGVRRQVQDHFRQEASL